MKYIKIVLIVLIIANFIYLILSLFLQQDTLLRIVYVLVTANAVFGGSILGKIRQNEKESR